MDSYFALGLRLFLLFLLLVTAHGVDLGAEVLAGLVIVIGLLLLGCPFLGCGLLLRGCSLFGRCTALGLGLFVLIVLIVILKEQPSARRNMD